MLHKTSLLQALVNRSVQLGVPGINVDFESLAGSDRNAFTAFISKLTAYAHAKGLVISIDLPRGSVKWNHLSAFDHEKLGAIVDYMVIMAYDQYWRGSTSPGSVAGIPWADGGIQEFLSYGIPRDKIILGIPYYVREWQLDAAGALASNRTFLMKDIPALMASKTTTTNMGHNSNNIESSIKKMVSPMCSGWRIKLPSRPVWTWRKSMTSQVSQLGGLGMINRIYGN